MQKFTDTRINAKTETGIAEHTDKYPVPTGEDPNQYLQASELNTINSKINQNTDDVKDLMLLGNELVDETKKKIDDGFFSNSEEGSNVFLTVGEYGKRDILLTNVNLISIAGIKTQADTGFYIAPHIGKRYQIINKTGRDVILVHNTATTGYYFAIKTLKGGNITLPNNEVIEFCWYPDGLYERFKTWEITAEFSKIIANSGYVKTSTDFTLNAGTEWTINGVPYANATDVVLLISLADSGKHRWDRVVLNDDNTAVLVQGEEFLLEEEPPVPPLEPNTLEYSLFRVTDTEIGTPSNPTLGTQFIEKTDFLVHNFVGSGSDVVIPLLTNGASEIRLQSGLTPLISIDGFDLSLITGNPDAKVPYNGKIFLIRNTSTAPITLKNFGDADFKFYSLSGSDVVIPVNGTITVKYGSSGGESSFTEYFRNWTEPIDLSTKADLVGGKVPASQLPSYVDDVLEFANKDSFPVIGESGKIYIALDKDLTYRWSGSVYVQIGGTAKKTENLFFQDAIGSTLRTITADQKNMHQSRYLANASPFGQLGLTLGNGIPETSGVINLAYFSDVITPQITGDYVGKVKKIVFSYSRNVNESSNNTNVMIRVMADTKYNTNMQLIAEHNLVSTTTLANAEHKVEIPVLTHLPLSAFSNIGWCIRSNNATAQQFARIKINVIVEEI